VICGRSMGTGMGMRALRGKRMTHDLELANMQIDKQFIFDELRKAGQNQHVEKAM